MKNPLKNYKEAEEKTTFIDKRERRRLIFAAGAGNFLEVFDFTVYSFFAATIGIVFFNVDDSIVSLLISVSVFGVGFIMRPLGSIIIGSYADRSGRKAAMLLTIVLMAFGSMLIAFTPPYHILSIAAPMLIVLGRLVQGFSAGGEIGAATALLMESATPKNQGFYVSWLYVGQASASICGSFLAAGLDHTLTFTQMQSWGWRVPFILSLLIIPVGLYCRRHLEETYGDDHPHIPKLRYPFKELVILHWRDILKGILIIFPGTATMYILIFYMPNYLQITTHISPTNAFLVSTYGSVIMGIFAFISGFVYDNIENTKKTLLIIIGISFISSYFTFYFLNNTLFFFLLYAVDTACIGLIISISTLFIARAFAQNIRATAAAVIYAFGVTIFGSVAQATVTLFLKLSHNNIMAPFWYVGLSLVCGWFAVLFFPSSQYKGSVL